MDKDYLTAAEIAIANTRPGFVYSEDVTKLLAKKHNPEARRFLKERQVLQIANTKLLILVGPEDAGSKEFNDWVQSNHAAGRADGLTALQVVNRMIEAVLDHQKREERARQANDQEG